MRIWKSCIDHLVIDLCIYIATDLSFVSYILILILIRVIIRSLVTHLGDRHLWSLFSNLTTYFSSFDHISGKGFPQLLVLESGIL